MIRTHRIGLMTSSSLIRWALPSFRLGFLTLSAVALPLRSIPSSEGQQSATTGQLTIKEKPRLSDIEDFLAERGIEASYESIRRSCLKFGPGFRRRIKCSGGKLGDTWHVDEVFITIRG